MSLLKEFKTNKGVIEHLPCPTDIVIDDSTYHLAEYVSLSGNTAVNSVNEPVMLNLDGSSTDAQNKTKRVEDGSIYTINGSTSVVNGRLKSMGVKKDNKYYVVKVNNTSPIDLIVCSGLSVFKSNDNLILGGKQ